jgi:hypothetical protein
VYTYVEVPSEMSENIETKETLANIADLKASSSLSSQSNPNDGKQESKNIAEKFGRIPLSRPTRRRRTTKTPLNPIFLRYSTEKQWTTPAMMPTTRVISAHRLSRRRTTKTPPHKHTPLPHTHHYHTYTHNHTCTRIYIYIYIYNITYPPSQGHNTNYHV